MSQPASAAAAGEGEEHAAWADALDVDDSGFLRRRPASSPSPLRSCAAPRRGSAPAASVSLVQDAARLRSSLLPSACPAARGDGQADDADFSLAPWLHALRSLGEARAWKRQLIAAIRGDRALYRARLVVGMVMSCTRNGLGDLFLSLKDPSGIIGASVHQKVFTKEENMVVSVGCVIILKKVAVFRPSHKACYLNITEENLEMLVPKDFCFPSKQVCSSSPSESQYPVKCAETRGSSCQGDNHIRKTGAETYGQTTGICHKISSTKDVRIADVFSDNNYAANAVRDSMLRMDKGSTQGVENHQDIRLEEKDINPSNRNTPSYSVNQQLQKRINSFSPANCQKRQGSPCNKYGSRVESSTDNIMMRLLGGERIAPTRKKTVVAEVSCDHGGMPDANNSASRMDSDTSSSGKHQGIGRHKLMQRLACRHISNRNVEEQSLNVPENPKTRCSQSSLGGCSVMSGMGNSIEASSDEKLSHPLEGEGMLPSSKKQRSDAVLPDNVMSSMNVQIYGLVNNLNMGLDDVAQDVLIEHASIKKPSERQQKDFITGTSGIVVPTQENSSVSTSDATTVSASLHSHPNKMVSATEWTDDQLSELFVDY